ncbi:diphthine--ammonia ligase [Chryseobacterium indologenes]|uniref:Dph6-related ATP pyrophosphatase n=1 Tax=Chryseobacterium indologenes TaxID=253 RepID=UPI000F4E2005|nr:diphthine--ammonia ligase [Chryseobacterium indologenes]AYZ34172.1 diphthine--ammonia ligase [Chryseobacterium indologenes]MBF6642692.1 diphthine--ammonia ligase [Chryseobacterium indologenes]MBU3048740.1 diphthine--ammonia ligase [Chryseobacterium indologenes]MEB4762737.1 diphthine--ammonia ligase [Chryseobacterium indologenes]QQQ69257.1 diphthine--ammonia ligase [Chryseobacterium indologenes]
MKPQALFNWSSGKDSALALYKILQKNQYEVSTLLTSINEEFQRVSMHGVHVSLLEKQAESLRIPLVKMELPKEPSMEEYQKIMGNTMAEIQALGVTHSIFGDIFLEDLRKYREQQLNAIGMQAVFPLWKKDTSILIREFLDLGFKTIVTCVNGSYLDKGFAGRMIDHDFIKDLPENVDPCGENGEFHTFTFDGPIFKTPVAFEIGETVKKTYPKPKTDADKEDGEYVFWFSDLTLK